MNDRQNAKLNMAQRVSETLKRYNGTYSSIVSMFQAVDALDTDIANIREALKEQEHGTVSIPVAVVKKREAEAQMVDAALKASSALYVFGFTNDNKDLIGMSNVTESDFYKRSNNATLTLANRILDLTHQYSGELNDYGITTAEITELETAIENYRNLIVKPMDTIGKRKEKTTNLKQLFAGLDATLYDRLDKLMVLFKRSHPEFYREYRTARNIIFNIERRAPLQQSESQIRDVDDAEDKSDLIDSPSKPKP